MERNPTNPSPAATLRIIEARRDTRRCLAALAVLALLVVGGPAAAQFTAGSDGSDGALDFTGRCSGTLLWDASETRPDGQVLDPEGDGIFHFTTVTVPQGCTLRMLASRLGHKPIQWLVQGNVSISGDLNLDGTDGHSNQEGVALRLPAVPGPGGFAGGLGSLGGNADEPGFGPGGGLPGRGGAHSGSPGAAAGTSPSYGNIFLLPLLGGSGGGGSGGAGGGAGGGALLIASDTRINFPTNRDVFIRARGGDGVTGGAGGAIRLMAPTISGRAFIDTCSLRSCGLTGNLVGEFGRVRIESNNLSSNVRTARAVARRVRLTNTSPHNGRHPLVGGHRLRHGLRGGAPGRRKPPRRLQPRGCHVPRAGRTRPGHDRHRSGERARGNHRQRRDPRRELRDVECPIDSPGGDRSFLDRHRDLPVRCRLLTRHALR